MAFLIYRPVMRLFKIQGSSDTFWPLDNNHTSSASTGNSDAEATDNYDDVVLDVDSSQRPTMYCS